MITSLKEGHAFILGSTGTLVFCEELTATFAAVLTLPQQPAGWVPTLSFTPGRVGAKKISPFSTVEQVVSLTDLSTRNQQFLDHYQALRKKHNQQFVDREAGDTAGIESTARSVRGSRPCGQCGVSRTDHHTVSDHLFVKRARKARKERVPKAPRVPRPARVRPTAAPTTFVLVSEDMTTVRTHRLGDQFEDGRRFHRVVRALRSLPAQTGTLEDVVAAVVTDGGKQLANPEKVTRRALHLLASAAGGRCVTVNA